ncbi:hypothetical protein [Flavobacterium psychraquaticum]|uniref:hypothetical protein n=1 Tax=Flavobacterium psychraquaticum TaxID=3103958 RepID=UPI002ACE22D0|nr:hypothetical protein [Flavobacterium sp. LB-N7T]
MSKKFIFSAVALMAFSFAGMAQEKEQDNKTTESGTDCKVEKLSAYTQMRNDGLSHEQASGASYGIYFACLRLKTIIEF